MSETMPAGGAIYPSLKDRTVLVTGGGSGIGASIVAHFAAQGARTAFVDIARAPSEALERGLREAGGDVRFFPCDLTDIPALERCIADIADALGPVTVLVNNAARDDRHTFQEVTSEYWDRALDVNLKHQFFCARAVHPMMKASGGGAIVNMGSISWMIGNGGYVAYTAAKSAVLGLTRSLARDMGTDNIRVNSIAPGWIITERQKELWLTEEGERQIMERQCLKRQLVPADIAKFVVFLASDEAAACTNQSYVVDGGWL